MKLRAPGIALVGAVLLGPLLVATPSNAAPPPAARTVATRAAVEPGSYLTVVENGRPVDYGGLDVTTQSLVLVSPTGEQRIVYTRRAKHHVTFTLSDWSVDGSTALLLAPNRTGADLIKVDVATGAAQLIKVPLLNSAVLDPAGTGAIVTAWKTPRAKTMVLDTVSWAGTVTRLGDKVTGQLLAGHAGTVLTADSRHQLLLSATTGATVSRFRVGGICSLVRWWDATRVLESCQQGNLYLVDPTTGSASRLTHTHGQGDYGHLDGRYAGSNLYVQVAGACGYTYVAKVTKRSTKPIKVPDAVGNVIMVNAVGNDLVLEHAASCDGKRPRPELTTYDPATRHETPLVTLGRRQDFGGVLVLGEVRATTY